MHACLCVVLRVASAVCRSAWPAWVWKQPLAALTFSIVQTWKRKMRRTHRRVEMTGQCHQRSEKREHALFNALIHCKAHWEYLFGVKFPINSIDKLRTSQSQVTGVPQPSLQICDFMWLRLLDCKPFQDSQLSSPIVSLWMTLTMSFHLDSSRQESRLGTPSFSTSHLTTGCRSLDCVLVVHLKKCSSQLSVQNRCSSFYFSPEIVSMFW